MKKISLPLALIMNNSLHESAIKLDIAFHDKVPFSITVARKKIRQVLVKLDILIFFYQFY